LVNILFFQSRLNCFQFFGSNDGNDKLHNHFPFLQDAVSISDFRLSLAPLGGARQTSHSQTSQTYAYLGGCWA
jgi:hypothetical protein